MKIYLIHIFFFIQIVQINAQEERGKLFIRNSIGYQFNLPEEDSPETGNTRVSKSVFNSFYYDIALFSRLNNTISFGLGMGYSFYDGNDQASDFIAAGVTRSHQIRFSLYNRFEHSISNKIGMIHQLSLNAQTGSHVREQDDLFPKAGGSNGQLGFNYIPTVYFRLKENLNLEVSAFGAEILYYEVSSSLPEITFSNGIANRIIKGIQIGISYFL
jgi:hypothetical protein